MFRSMNYVRIASASPETTPCNVNKNLAKMIELAKAANKKEADIILFPELSLTSYTCGDLFRQKTLLKAAFQGLLNFSNSTKAMNITSVVGIPLLHKGSLFNCAAVVHKGNILGIIPKTYIPNNNEYYEARWFTTSLDNNDKYIKIMEKEVPFRTEVIFQSEDQRGFTFSVEICEDLWAVNPPSGYHSLAGAEIILNLSASNELTGKASYRKNLVLSQSARGLCGYIYASSGTGESTTDTVFGGHLIIAENGKILAENERFLLGGSIVYADIDIDLIRHERMNNVSFTQRKNLINTYTFVTLNDSKGRKNLNLYREINSRPFVPESREKREPRCNEIINIQSTALAIRMKHTNILKAVIGLSGGLDSTLALLVTLDAYKKLGLNNSEIIPISMPGFGTSTRTKGNVEKLCFELGLKLRTISIVKAAEQHLEDIGHNGYSKDITYENTQARERTQILMDLANMNNALVIGTGDLSELALGWCTYNGDHMSMYSVNSGVPKTLVSYLIDYFADFKTSKEVSLILKDIINTPISPELLPPDKDGSIAQKTEDTIGPYVLHDFFLYYVVRMGYPPAKIYFLAQKAFGDTFNGKEIKKWLIYFYNRFFSQQFKRSALPDGPKVGTIALSPRGDWRMPSDASVQLWIEDLKNIKVKN